MAERTAIACEQIPAPFGHYSQAIKMENQIHVSGIYPLDVKTGRLAGPEPEKQCEQVFLNLTTLLQFAGAQLSNILMLRVYMVDFNDLKALEMVSKKHFFFVPPARTLVPVPWLPYGARFCLDAVVYVPPVKVDGKMMF